MLTLSSVRLRWRESVSLGRFENCNLLEMDNFRQHGVEDEFGRTPESVKPAPAPPQYWQVQSRGCYYP